MKRFSSSPNDTLSSPVERGHMVSCWQNGRRVLMHSSEVARMMKKGTQNPSPRARRTCAVRANKAERGEGGERQSREPDEGRAQIAPLTRSLRDHPLPVTNGERGERDGHAEAVKAIASHDLTPPPLVPRSRTLAGHEIWQKLAKEMARVAGHPPRCHKPSCRRAKQCTGGADACYLREFDAVDVAMQRFLQSHARELRAAAERPMSSAGCGGAKS